MRGSGVKKKKISMKYTRKDFPEYFVVKARTQEEANQICNFMQGLGIKPCGDKYDYHWSVYKEDTLYYAEGFDNYCLYGNQSGYDESIGEGDGSYTRYVFYDSYTDFLLKNGLNKDIYEIY